MKNRPATHYLLGLVLALAGAPLAADAPPIAFHFTTINVPGARQTFPSGVNNAGVFVGTYQDKKMLLHGYILSGKKLTTLDDPNGTNTSVSNLNPNGTISIVGAYLNSGGSPVGFLYQGGNYTDIPGPAGATATVPSGISDSGNIVGFFLDSGGAAHGFLLQGTTYTILDVPGAAATYATGINRRGKIVLHWVNARGRFESSLYNGQTYKTINVPGAKQSLAVDIDSVGDVVYEWLDAGRHAHGALRHAGQFYKFDYPNAAETIPAGINDKHFIVGPYQAVGMGPFQGFKAAYQ